MTAKKKSLLAKLLLFLLLTIIIYGCTEEDSETVGSDLLSKAEIIACLEEEGLQLQKTRTASPLKDKFAVKPAAFRVGDKGETSFIYVFDSFADRKDAFPAIHAIVSEDKGPYFIFTAKNALIIYEPGDDHSVMLKTCSRIGEAAFHGMHDINQVTFKGQGDYWVAEIKVLYYEYEWREGEEQQQESYGREYFQAKYLGENPTEVTEFYFTYSFDKEESRTKGIYGSRLDENGTYTDFEAGSYFPREDDIINMTFEWDGKEEIIELKAITY